MRSSTLHHPISQFSAIHLEFKTVDTDSIVMKIQHASGRGVWTDYPVIYTGIANRHGHV